MDEATQNLLAQLAYNDLLARQLGAAETIYRVLTDLNPDNLSACLGLCYCLLQGSSWMEAEPVLTRLPQLAKNPAQQAAIARLQERWQYLRSIPTALEHSA